MTSSASHEHSPLFDHAHFPVDRARRLNDPGRLERHVSEQDLLRLLALRGDEDVADLGSGTGFYTDIVARRTTGTVYAVDLAPQMHDAYRQKGVPANVRLMEADIRAVPLPAESIDVAYSIATLHEIKGDLGLEHLLPALRSPGRVVIVDFRVEAATFEGGPPVSHRISNEKAAAIFLPYFEHVTVEDVGEMMFALVASGTRAVPLP